MKSRRLLLSLAVLPTIAETLEDVGALPALPPLPPASQPAHGSPSLDDYMSSIQALARPPAPPSCGPVRVQRASSSARPRLFVKHQAKHTASAARGSPRSIRTSRLSTLSRNGDEFGLRTGGERDCMGRDPVDWLFAQTQART